MLQPVFAPTDRQYENLKPEGPYFPEEAAKADVAGAASLKCRVASSGALTDCMLLAEIPIGYDFGVYALRMADDGFLTATPDRSAFDGTWVRIAVAFPRPAAKAHSER